EESSAPHGRSESRDGAAGELRAGEGESRFGVAALPVSERDVLARAFSVRLEIEQQDVITLLAEKPGAFHHAEPIRTDAMHQDDRAARLLGVAQPAREHAPRATRNRDDLGPHIRRWKPDPGRHRPGEGAAGEQDTTDTARYGGASKQGEDLRPHREESLPASLNGAMGGV